MTALQEPTLNPLQNYYNRIKTMVVKANRLADDIRIATVIPRIPRSDYDPDFSERIDTFNTGPVSICRDNDNYRLMKNDDNFKLRDGDINDGYIAEDDTHHAKTGTNELAKIYSFGKYIPELKSNLQCALNSRNGTLQIGLFRVVSHKKSNINKFQRIQLLLATLII